MCGEPFIAAVRRERVRIINDNVVAQDFSELRSELHTDQRRAPEL